jgi:hypothetical protein
MIPWAVAIAIVLVLVQMAGWAWLERRERRRRLARATVAAAGIARAAVQQYAAHAITTADFDAEVRRALHLVREAAAR